MRRMGAVETQRGPFGEGVYAEAARLERRVCLRCSTALRVCYEMPGTCLAYDSMPGTEQV
eukprot:3089192-Rhodomonas_salina.1